MPWRVSGREPSGQPSGPGRRLRSGPRPTGRPTLGWNVLIAALLVAPMAHAQQTPTERRSQVVQVPGVESSSPPRSPQPAAPAPTYGTTEPTPTQGDPRTGAAPTRVYTPTDSAPTRVYTATESAPTSVYPAAEPTPTPGYPVTGPTPTPGVPPPAQAPPTPRLGAAPFDPAYDPNAEPEVLTGPADLSSADQEIAEIEGLIEQAHYRTALSVASSTRRLLLRAEPGAAVDIRRARLEVLCATARVALGEPMAARSHLELAHRANPELELDPSSVSPKVMELWRSVQRGEPRWLSQPGPMSGPMPGPRP